MAGRWYVYELIDPSNGDVFYVGKGSGDRMYLHGKPNDTTNQHKINKINKIGYENVIRRKFAEFWDEQAAYSCESERICDLIKTGKLTNKAISTSLADSNSRQVFNYTISDCVSFLESAGFLAMYDIENHDFDILGVEVNDEDYKLLKMLVKKCAKQVDYMIQQLVALRLNGKKTPDKIRSRNIVLNLSDVYACS